jgi:hypothetical protein
LEKKNEKKRDADEIKTKQNIKQYKKKETG